MPPARTRAPPPRPPRRMPVTVGRGIGYQRLSDEELFCVQGVALTGSLEKLISRAGAKAVCDGCGEEVFNGREVREAGRVLCRACAGLTYYAKLAQA